MSRASRKRASEALIQQRAAYIGNRTEAHQKARDAAAQRMRKLHRELVEVGRSRRQQADHNATLQALTTPAAILTHLDGAMVWADMWRDKGEQPSMDAEGYAIAAHRTARNAVDVARDAIHRLRDANGALPDLPALTGDHRVDAESLRQWCREQSRQRLTINQQAHTLMLDGQTHPASVGDLEALSRLMAGDGVNVAAPSGMRWSEIKQRLPGELAAMIHVKRGPGGGARLIL